MIFQTLKHIITSKDLCAQIKIAEIMKLEGCLIFYHAGIETGLFKILREPLTPAQVAMKLNIKDSKLLSSLLDLGSSTGELSCRKGKYSLKGATAKALISNTPVTELIRETVLFHGDIAAKLGMYLKKNIKGNYLKDFGGIIAESSRLTEPFIKTFIYQTVKKTKPLTILEIGCGAGEYLKYYVDINRNNTGTAIDIDTSAVEIARGKLKENNIENNFTVLHDDILKAETVKDMRFDLVTSYSNMHYFSDDEKRRVFNNVHGLLNNNGRFMLATGFKSGSLSSCYYNLLFSATQGLYPLPRIDDIIDYMKRSGFSRIKVIKLFGKSFMGIVAYK